MPGEVDRIWTTTVEGRGGLGRGNLDWAVGGREKKRHRTRVRGYLPSVPAQLDWVLEHLVEGPPASGQRPRVDSWRRHLVRGRLVSPWTGAEAAGAASLERRGGTQNPIPQNAPRATNRRLTKN